MDDPIRLPDPCVVVLVGPAGCGKSTWAASWFPADSVVSSDRLRAMVGTGERDQRAGTAAFEVLDLIVAHRLRRRLTTVIDTTGLESSRRRGWVEQAATAGMPVVAVVFDVPEREVRRRNRERPDPVPSNVVTAQLTSAATAREQIADEGFTAVIAPDPVILVPPHLVTAPAAARRQQEDPMPLTFALQVSRFPWPADEIGARLGAVAEQAEEIGFDSLWVMDHVVQIPQVGREWDPMLEPYTTLGFVAGRTRTLGLGCLCTGITYRNIAHLAKIVATLDVLSGGRARAGLGLGWFAREHTLYDWPFPPVAERYDRLEDALELLPLMWGPGSPRFEGRTTTVPEAICYPRPVQERVPILVGGSGERRTLRLVARYADACNLFGDTDTVRRKIEVLRHHCAEVDRDPAEVTVTRLAEAAVIGADDDRPHEGAGTVTEQIGRFRADAEAGVQTAFVSLTDLDTGGLDRFADVIAAFR